MSLPGCVLGNVSRRIRFLPYPETLVEVTNRTIHGRLLLLPSKHLRSITLGVLGRAQRLFGVEIHAFVFLSNHYHLLVTVRDVEQMARFVGYFQSKLAREVARQTGWRDKIWARRYTAIPVSNEQAAQVARLKYLLSHGTKEKLVAHPAQWPGAHSVRALLEGSPLTGYWYNRTAEFQAKARGERYRRDDFAEVEAVELSPLPCWKHLSEGRYRAEVGRLIEGIVRQAGGDPKEDIERSLARQQPTDRPSFSKRSPAPWFHCSTKAARIELRNAYEYFLSAYRSAAVALSRGELTAPFPEGCFPRPLPFVPSS